MQNKSCFPTALELLFLPILRGDFNKGVKSHLFLLYQCYLNLSWVFISVQLARRVFQLERVNSGLRDEVRWEEEKVSRFQEELEQCRELIHCSQQPGSYLLDRLKELQQKLHHNHDIINKMEEEITTLKQENSGLKDTKNKMSVDLEKLLSHREVSGRVMMASHVHN